MVNTGPNLIPAKFGWFGSNPAPTWLNWGHSFPSSADFGPNLARLWVDVVSCRESTSEMRRKERSRRGVHQGVTWASVDGALDTPGRLKNPRIASSDASCTDSRQPPCQEWPLRYDRGHSDQPKLDRLRPKSDQIPPTLSNFGQLRPTIGRLRPALTDFGQHWP